MVLSPPRSRNQRLAETTTGSAPGSVTARRCASFSTPQPPWSLRLKQRDHLIGLVFAEVPRGEIYRRAGLRVATAAELEQPIEDRHLRVLTDDERQDIAYHRPGRLGDLLFNWFD